MLGQFDQHAARAAGVEERDALALRTGAGRLVDEPDAGGAAARQGGVQILDGEADVMDAGAALREEPGDGRVRGLGLEQLDERVAGLESGNAGTIRIIEPHLGHAEDIPVERQERVEGMHRDSNVRDAGASGLGWHGNSAPAVSSAQT